MTAQVVVVELTILHDPCQLVTFSFYKLHPEHDSHHR